MRGKVSINFFLDHQWGTISTRIFKEKHSKSQSLLSWINNSSKNVGIPLSFSLCLHKRRYACGVDEESIHLWIVKCFNFHRLSTKCDAFSNLGFQNLMNHWFKDIWSVETRKPVVLTIPKLKYTFTEKAWSKISHLKTILHPFKT